MAEITLTGKIKRIFPAEVRGNFEKRILWLNTDGQYPQTYSLEFTQGDCNKLDNFTAGQTVTCNVNVRGRYWSKDGKEGVMNTLKCWKIEADKSQPAQSADDFPPATEPIDDLPF